MLATSDFSIYSTSLTSLMTSLIFTRTASEGPLLGHMSSKTLSLIFFMESNVILYSSLIFFISVLRLEDHLRQHPSYVKAAKAAIEVRSEGIFAEIPKLNKKLTLSLQQLYVYLHDNPDAKKGKPNGSLPNASE